jgi:hypothetical protein
VKGDLQMYKAFRVTVVGAIGIAALSLAVSGQCREWF